VLPAETGMVLPIEGKQASSRKMGNPKRRHAGVRCHRLNAIGTLEREVLHRLPPSMKCPTGLVELACAHTACAGCTGSRS
jgi:hypothetical protein